MKTRARIAATLAAGALATSSLVGCGSDTGDGPEPQPVDHETTRQAVESNTTTASQNLRASIEFMRQTDMLGEMVGSIDDGGDCFDAEGPTDGSGSEPGGSFECEPAEPVEVELEQGTQDLIDLLNSRIFVESNIEQQTDLEVTYLLDGQTMCPADDFTEPADQQDCINEVDSLELRLVVTSFTQGDVDIEVLVGPNRFNPVDFELHDGSLAATVDLAETRSAMVFAAGVTGDDLSEMPSTMQGRVRGEFSHDGNGKATGTLSILQNVVISGQDYDVSVSKAQPAGRVTVDATTQTISGLLDLNAIDLRAPVTETETTWDAETGAESTTETSYEIALHLGGASFDADYAVGDERVDVHNVGLGNTTSTLDIDGKRVASIDLNKNHGRHLAFSLVSGEHGMELSVSPAFDLELMLAFAQVQDKLDGLDDWVLDDLLRVTLDGAANPAVRIGDSGVEVLDGQLSISSTAAGVSHQVSAGQCLLPPEGDAPEPVSGTGSGSSDGSGTPVPEDDSTSIHPFEEFAVGACQ